MAYQAPHTIFTQRHLSHISELWITAAEKVIADLENAGTKKRQIQPKAPNILESLTFALKNQQAGHIGEPSMTLDEFKEKLGRLKESVKAAASDESIILRGDGKRDEIDREKVKAVLKNVKLDSFKHYPYELAAAIRAFFEVEWADPMEKLKDHYISLLNETVEWNPIPKSIAAPGGKTYDVLLTPVNEHFHPTFKDHGKTGFASMSPRLKVKGDREEQKRPTNLWHSTFSSEGQLLFECFRSGTISYPFDDVKEDKRKEFSKEKAKEILKAMLIRHLQKSKEAGRQQHIDRVLAGTETPLIRVVNINVQTPVDKSTPAAGMFSDVVEMGSILDHMEGLKSFHGDPKVEFEIDWEGAHKITPMFQIAAFNFGVNGAADSTFFKPGLDYQRPHNDEEMKILKSMYDEFVQHHLDDTSFIPAVNALDLGAQLYTQIEKNLHDAQSYGTPARITNLAHLMGAMVHFNCKSGKDRTSVLALESHFLAWQIHDQGKVPKFENVISSTNEKRLHRQLIFESGNLELQALNTGLPGYKIVPFKTMEKSLYDRFGRHLKMAKGMCRDVVVRPTYEGGKKTRPVYQKMKPRECLKRAQRIVKDL